MMSCSVPVGEERGTFLRGFLISNRRVVPHGGVHGVTGTLREAIMCVSAAAWITLILLGAVVPLSNIYMPVAQASSLTTSINVTVIVMIKSLNTSITVAIQKLVSLNISKNSTEWELVMEANKSLQMAMQANKTGDYTAALKYAEEGLEKVRKALEMIVSEYQVKTSEATMIIMKYEGRVRALNRTAYMLLNATTRAVERGAINSTIATELRDVLTKDIAVLTNMSEYLSKVLNGTITLNTTYVNNTLKSVAKDLARAREILNNCAAERLQLKVREKLVNRIMEMQKEIKKIVQAAQEAQSMNLTLMSKELMSLAENITQRLAKIEKLIVGPGPLNASAIEKLLNLTSEVNVIVTVGHEIQCHVRHATELKDIMTDVAGLRSVLVKVNLTFTKVQAMSKLMGGDVAGDVQNMEKLVSALNGNYSRLERALALGNLTAVKECLKAINATVTQLSSDVEKLMNMSMWHQPLANQFKNSLNEFNDLLKNMMHIMMVKTQKIERAVSVSHKAKLKVIESLLKRVITDIGKVIAIGKSSGTLTNTQLSKLQGVRVSISKAISLIKENDVSNALVIIRNSISVLVEVEHEVSMSKEHSFISVNVEVLVKVLHSIESMVGSDE